MQDVWETSSRRLPFKKLVWVRHPTVFTLSFKGEPVPHGRRYLSKERERILWNQLQEWVREGVIARVSQGFPIQLVFVAKKNGATRVCGDYRPINDATEEFKWPLPRLQDLRHWIRGFQWFAVIDLKDAFHRISVHPDYRRWCCYFTPWGLYELRKMTFGLTSAPAYFQRYLDSLLQQHQLYAIWYQDDILIAGMTKQETMTRLRAVQATLESGGNVINWDKSSLPAQEVTWCGLNLAPGRIRAGNPLARDLPVPYTKKDRQSALGWINYFRDHIPWLSHFTESLQPNKDNLTRSQQYEEDWARALKACENAVDLHHWTPGKEAKLYVDASAYAMGGMLTQENKVVAMWSKKLTGAQTRYSATDREHLALATSAQKFQIFLDDKDVTTRAYTDHLALINRDWKELRPIQVRWVLTIKRYIRNLEHMPGKDNPADFLSRKGAYGGGNFQ